MTAKEEQEKMLNPILPGLIEKLTNALINPNPSQSSFVLKTEIIKGKTKRIVCAISSFFKKASFHISYNHFFFC